MRTPDYSAGLAGSPVIQVHLMHKCPIVSAGLGAILSQQPDFRVSAGPDAAALPAGACVVVADYESGVAVARERWHRAGGHTAQPVLALTYRAKASAIRHAMVSGVRGYVIQDCDASEVLNGVRLLSRGGYYLSPIAGRLEAEWLRRPPLTQREAEVLRVLVRGSSDKAIARGLGIGVGTVKSDLKQLFMKLDVSTRTQAVIKAMDLGLHETLDHIGSPST
jgi:DNA-binding NarL/FixJ family response regulator